MSHPINTYLFPQSLTNYSRPIYVDDEIELCLIEHVNFYVGEAKEHRDGKVIVTTHRIVYVTPSAKQAFYLHHAHIHNVDTVNGFLAFSSPKVIIQFTDRPQLQESCNFDVRSGCYLLSPPTDSPAEANSASFHYVKASSKHRNLIHNPQQQLLNVSPSASEPQPDPLATISYINSPTPNYVKFGFKESGRDSFVEKIRQAHQAAQWNTYHEALLWEKSKNVIVASKKSFSTSAAGVGGIIRSSQDNAKRTDVALQAAFTDLSALMKHATDIVQLAEKFARAQQNASDGNSQGSSSENQTKAEKEQFDTMLNELGIANPVTKQTSGTAFHLHLAGQLNEFLAMWLERKATEKNRRKQVDDSDGASSGALPLTDVFCLYNRARGTDLISPEDLLHAIRLFPKMKCPWRLQEYSSGAKVLIYEGVAEKQSSERLVNILIDKGPQSVLSLSQMLDMPLTIIEQWLVVAEGREKVVRDQSVEGLLWYENRFPQWITS